MLMFCCNITMYIYNKKVKQDNISMTQIRKNTFSRINVKHNLCQWSNTILQRKIDNNDNNDNNIKKKKPIILTGSHENDFNITPEER